MSTASMDMQANVSAALSKLKRASEDMAGRPMAERLQAALMTIRGDIIKRTQNGLDADDRPFIKYSDSYKELKDGGKFKRGKKSRGATVNLTLEGRMLDAMQVRVFPDNKGNTEGVINFPNRAEAEKARRHNEGLDGMPKRRFFALGKDQLRQLVNKLRIGRNG